jgi:hypothetical protein
MSIAHSRSGIRGIGITGTRYHDGRDSSLHFGLPECGGAESGG